MTLPTQRTSLGAKFPHCAPLRRMRAGGRGLAPSGGSLRLPSCARGALNAHSRAPGRAAADARGSSSAPVALPWAYIDSTGCDRSRVAKLLLTQRHTSPTPLPGCQEYLYWSSRKTHQHDQVPGRCFKLYSCAPPWPRGRRPRQQGGRSYLPR